MVHGPFSDFGLPVNWSVADVVRIGRQWWTYLGRPQQQKKFVPVLIVSREFESNIRSVSFGTRQQDLGRD
jgi:hypothetical protein